MNTLICTLGKSKISYEKVRYQFEGNYTSDETSFLGIALLRYLQSRHNDINRVVFLGTDESTWNALLEIDGISDKQEAELLIGLFASKNTEDETLTRLSKLISGVLGIEFECVKIPYCKTEEEQQKVILILNEKIEKDENVWMDVTHGFRHLPLLQFLSVLHLRNVKQITVKAIYYGAMEMAENKIVPVINIDWSLKLQKWIEVVVVAQYTGNLAVLAEAPDVPDNLREQLIKFSFLLQTNQLANAKKSASEIYKFFDKDTKIPMLELFKEEIKSLVGWTNESSFVKRQFEQAKIAFSHNDFLTAVILLHETKITMNVKTGSDPLNYDSRIEAKHKLGTTDIDILRHALVHATRADKKEVQNAMSSLDNIKTFIKRYIDELEIKINN